MHAQFRVIVVTDPPTNPQTGPITIHYATASAQCNKQEFTIQQTFHDSEEAVTNYDTNQQCCFIAVSQYQ